CPSGWAAVGRDGALDEQVRPAFGVARPTASRLTPDSRRREDRGSSSMTERSRKRAPPPIRAPEPAASGSAPPARQAGALLALQRGLGNRALARLIGD